MKIPQVSFTNQAMELLNRLSVQGSLVLHLSDGCCDGSVPNCYLKDEFYSDDNDVVVFEDALVQMLIPKDTIQRYGNELTVDVYHGQSSGFSLEVALGKRFMIV